MNRLWGGTVLGLAVILLAGCGGGGEPTVSVSGHLREGGQPVKIVTQGLPPGDKGIRVGFIRQDKSPETFYAKVADDGSFTVPGPKNRGIPAGKYQISVHRGAMGSPDHYKDAFKAEKSPLNVDIPAGRSATVDIDLTAKTAAVK